MRIELMTSPLPRECSTTEPREPNKIKYVVRIESHSLAKKNGACDRVRTCDINLGRVALYQLSYARNYHIIYVFILILASLDLNKNMVARDGFEPSKVYTDRFTVCCLWPLGNLAKIIQKMELTIGVEPTTVGLQNRCSTN
jgi:hypothetical protein